MGIAIAIILGLIAMTGLAVVGDVMGKRASRLPDKNLESRIASLESRLHLMEAAQIEKDEKIEKLSGELSFLNKLLDKQ